jgi:two-component system KDP operon response regulator KdpE
MNVLIVDDDAAMGLLIAASLRALAGNIQIATNFADAKDWIAKAVFNLVLLDLGLPDSPAHITITRVKDMRAGGAKVAIISGAWPPGVEIQPATSGADAVIYKGDMDMLEKLKALVAKPSAASLQPRG